MSRTDVLRCRMPSTRDQHPYNIAYYARNRDAEIARVTMRQQATLAWLRDLRRVPCMDCGGLFPPHVMDFDHRDPAAKSFNLTSGRAMLASRARLEAEIAKCDIVCANCHRMRTYAAFLRGSLRPATFVRRDTAGTADQLRARASFRSKSDEHRALLRELRSVPCVDCGRTLPWFVMQFDHRDPTSKSAVVTRMVGRVGTRRLLEEIAKCDIVCTNCHRDRTYRQWQERGCVVMAASKASILEVRVRFPPPAQADELRLIEESATHYRFSA